jgi:hypothetical protein
MVIIFRQDESENKGAKISQDYEKMEKKALKAFSLLNNI